MELAARLDRARATYDESRLIDTNDPAYEVWLQAKLQRVIELHNEDVERQRRESNG